jgi:hypothetical protein
MTKMQKAGHKAWETRRKNSQPVSRQEFQTLKDSHRKLVDIVEGILPLIKYEL